MRLQQQADGDMYLPAFLSMDELNRGQVIWKNTSLRTVDELKHILIDLPETVKGIVINPFGNSFVLERANLAKIDKETEGMILQRVDHPEKQILSPLKSHPAGLTTALRKLFVDIPEISRAWILAARPDYSTQPHKLFVIEFFGDRRLLFPIIAKTIEPFMKPGESFELMKADLDLARDASKKTRPFYVKIR